nr:hypothetical protein [Calditrichia bacterium]
YRWYGEQFGNTYFQTFDRVLLDPACSGLGTLHKNPEILSWWTPAYCDRLSQTQQSLLISAIKSLRPGGVMTYSTCTLTPQENEAVIDFALQNYPVEVEEINLSGIKSWPGLTSYEGQHFHPDLSKTIRLYPFDRISEGFYVARLRKTDTMKAPSPERQKKPRKVGFLSRTTSPVKKYLDYLSGRFEIPDSILENFAYTLKNDIFFASKDFHQFLFYGKPLQVGLPLAHTMTQAAKLNTTGAQILGEFVQKHLVELDDLKTLEKFINRDGLDILVDNSGQFVVKYKECGIGYGIAENGRLKSQFPKAEWPFELSESE